MKRKFRFSLRTLVIGFSAASVLLGLSIMYLQRGIEQRKNIEFLFAYEYRFPDDGSAFPDELLSTTTHIDVVYRDQVSWSSAENRFIRDLPHRDNWLYNWIRETLGRDFVTTPIAIELCCNDRDRESGKMISTMDDSVVQRIKLLPTIQQLWVIQTMQNGELVNVYKNEDLKSHFPDLKFQSTAIKESP